MAEDGKLPVSVCLIVRDEESCLARCLASVRAFAAEIVVADTGSTDSSVRIAEAFGADVFALTWTDDFAAARNATLARAREPWILVLDADERWASPPAELAQLLAGGIAEGAYGFCVTVESKVGDGEERVTDAVCRLFRNDPRIRFRGTIHEEAASSILAFAPEGVAMTALVIRHDGYLEETIRRKNKPARNLALIEAALARQPDEPTLRYALGTELFGRGDYEHALETLLPLLELVPPSEGYASDLGMKAAYALKMTGRREEALRLTERLTATYPDFASALELRADLQAEAGALAAAYRSLLLAEEAAGAPGRLYSEASGAGTYRSRYLAGAISERALLYERACEDYERALAYEPGHAPSWRRLAVVCAATGRMERLGAVLAARGEPAIPVQRQVAAALVDCRQPQWLAAWREPLAEGLAALPAAEALAAAQAGDLERAERLLEREAGPEAAACRWALACLRAKRLLPAPAPAPGAASASPAMLRLALVRLGAVDAWLASLAAADAAAAMGLADALRVGLLHAPRGALRRLAEAPALRADAASRQLAAAAALLGGDLRGALPLLAAAASAGESPTAHAGLALALRLLAEQTADACRLPATNTNNPVSTAAIFAAADLAAIRTLVL